MNPPSPSPTPATLGRTLPAGQTETSFNSAFVRVENFVFNPTLVTAFVQRLAEGSSPTTEVFYEGHHIVVEDPKQALFFYLCYLTKPQPIDNL